MTAEPEVLAEVLSALETFTAEFAEEIGFAVNQDEGTAVAEIYGEEEILKRYNITITVTPIEN